MPLHPNSFTVTHQSAPLVNLADKPADLFLVRKPVQFETNKAFCQLIKPNQVNQSSSIILCVQLEGKNSLASTKEMK